MYCAGSNFLGQTRNWIASSAIPKQFLLAQNWIYYLEIIFWSGTLCKPIFGLAYKIQTSPKYFEPCRRTRHQNSVGIRRANQKLLYNFLEDNITYSQLSLFSKPATIKTLKPWLHQGLGFLATVGTWNLGWVCLTYWLIQLLFLSFWVDLLHECFWSCRVYSIPG